MSYPDYTQGMPDPNSVMGPMPVAAAPPLSLWERLQQVVSPAPTDGLLSEQDVKNARNQGLLGFGSALLQQSGPTDAAHRVTFGGAVGRAMQAGQGTYQDAVNAQRQAIQQKQAFDINKLKMTAMQQDTAQTAKAQAARNAVFAKFPPPADGTDPNAVKTWIGQVTPALVAAQDFEGASKLIEYQKAMEKKDKYQFVQGGDAIYRGDPESGSLEKVADRGVPADEVALKKAALEETRARTAAMMGIANEHQLNSLSNGFQMRNKDLVGRAAPINQALLTAKSADDTPQGRTLYKSAIANFIQAADQKAQLRAQMLSYFSQLDPSIGGKWESLKSRLLNGTLPAYQRAAIITHLQNLLTQTKGEYERRRKGEVGRHPQLDGYIPQSDEIFNPEDSQVPTVAHTPESLESQYGGLTP